FFRYFSGSTIIHLGWHSLFLGGYVVDINRCRNDIYRFWNWLYGNECSGIYADGCDCIKYCHLRTVWQIIRYDCEVLGEKVITQEYVKKEGNRRIFIQRNLFMFN